ncbi:MAG: hypothetical protein ABR526_12180 [Chthoniobacterales bacterium]
MDDEAPDSFEDELTSRQPTLTDVVALCRELNHRGARYLVCGGFAIRAAGYLRETGDIDLLVDTSLENEAHVFKALETLPDKAVLELASGDVAKFIIVRVADEVVVDLMRSAAGIDFAAAERDIVVREVDGVPIPFASPQLLWRMKRHTHREKDQPDLLFLRQLFEADGITPPE